MRCPAQHHSRHHRVKLQAAGICPGEGHADNAAAIADDERHFLRRAMAGSDNQVALVLTVIIVGDNDDFAQLDGFNGGGNGISHGEIAHWIMTMEHLTSPLPQLRASLALQS